MKINLTFLILFISILSSSAQTHVVYGEINVFEDMKLQNIIVEAKHSGASAISDSLGNFSIVCTQNDVLKFKTKAFKPKKVKVDSETKNISVTLDFKDNPMIVELAVENGYISANNASYAKSNMNKDEVDYCQYNDIYEVIEGRFAGVRVMSNNSILIRGNTSLNGNNSALLVLDGRIVNSLADVSPCNIKRVDILKGGSASIYGNQASGGVVLVETKKAIPN